MPDGGSPVGRKRRVTWRSRTGPRSFSFFPKTSSTRLGSWRGKRRPHSSSRWACRSCSAPSSRRAWSGMATGRSSPTSRAKPGRSAVSAAWRAEGRALTANKGLPGRGSRGASAEATDGSAGHEGSGRRCGDHAGRSARVNECQKPRARTRQCWDGSGSHSWQRPRLRWLSVELTWCTLASSTRPRSNGSPCSMPPPSRPCSWRRKRSSRISRRSTRPHPCRTAGTSRAMRRAHLLRWRPRPHAQRTGSTPRVRPSGAALQLDPSHRSKRSFFSDGLLARIFTRPICFVGEGKRCPHGTGEYVRGRRPPRRLAPGVFASSCATRGERGGSATRDIIRSWSYSWPDD